MKPIETSYRGCRFRSRIEARWAVFFDTLGIKWWYEPEGFDLRFDYKQFATYWDMTEEELLQAGVPQTFQHLDGKEYSYLPDFYLPELDYWLEIKGPNPTREEVEKAFMLSWMVYAASMQRSKEAWADAVEEAMTEAVEEGLTDAESVEKAITRAESSPALKDIFRHGVYITYGDVPWPFPQKGNIFGYGSHHDSGSTFFDRLARSKYFAGESERKETAYRSLLGGKLKLCWQECPLCLKIGIGKIGTPYCRSCHDQMVKHTWTHVVEYRVMRDAAKRYGVEPSLLPPELHPLNVEAMQLTKDLINPEFFTSGHKSPKLREAYSAARSARFEHGQSP